MTFDQAECDIRMEWGQRGVETLAPISDVVIIVDVLSFSTSVDVAVSRGAVVYPYAGPRDGAAERARALAAELADPFRQGGDWSLSPASLLAARPGLRLLLPSPNGSTLTLAAQPARVLAGCLRNARAVAAAASRLGRRIAVIAAGERWRSDFSLRPGIEDLLGAGAIINCLNGARSPEAMSAAAAFDAAEPDLAGWLSRCSSGKELIDRGHARDVALAAELNASDCAPLLVDGAYAAADAPA